MDSKALLVSNQLDYSGAPMALLLLAHELKDLGIKLELASVEQDKGLWREFENLGARLVDLDALNYDDYTLIIYNTVATTRLVRALSNGSKSILWIHESPYLGGLLWSKAVEMRNASIVDEVWFPSASCQKEWSSYLQLEKIKSFILPSPVTIPDKSTRECLPKSEERTYIVVLDSPERYRRVDLVEQALVVTKNYLHLDFIGAGTPVSTYTPSPSVSVSYHGRLCHRDAIRIMERSEIYLSATLMATQNRAMCEAMCLHKGLVVTAIPAHLEYIRKVRYKKAITFAPFEHFNLDTLLQELQGLSFGERLPRLSIFSRQRFSTFVQARLREKVLAT